jgi:outer membrane protein assembly factor BamB
LSKRRILFALPLLALPFLAACASVDSPEGWVSPKVADDVIYISLDGGRMSALDTGSFDELWTFPENDETRCPGRDEKIDLEAIYGEPAVGDKTVYLTAYDGRAYALAKDDGECLWSFTTEDPVIAGPVLDGDRLFVASTDGITYVLSADTGEEEGRIEAGNAYATPLLTEDGELFIATMDGEVRKYDSTSLEEAWDAPFDATAGLLTAPLVISGDTLIVGGLAGMLYGLDPETGAQRWSRSERNWFWGNPVLTSPDSSTILATNLSGKIFGVNAADSGNDAWPPVDALAPVRAGAAVSDDGTAVVVNNDGLVFLLDAETGEVREQVDLKKGVFSTPVIAGGSAVILSKSNDIFVVDLETGSVDEVNR